MARKAGAAPLSSVENHFVNGLKTEFTGMNFPENAAVDTDNCIFDRRGRVLRRKGIDIENSGSYSTYDRTLSTVSSYFWINASGDGITNLLVIQAGATLRFYEVSDASTSPSGRILATTVNLASFQINGAPSVALDECQFSQGNGYLFVFHPHMQSIYCSYDPTSKTVSPNGIAIQIRDFEGIDEQIPDTQRSTSLTTNHRYNLGNQGWRSGWVLSSATSATLSAGSTATFVVSITAAATPIHVGDTVLIINANVPNAAAFGIGNVTAYSTTVMTVNITFVVGSVTSSNWAISQFPDYINTWYNSTTSPTNATFPSNADIWYFYKNSSDAFDPAGTYANVAPPTAPAPKGHYLVDPFNINRAVVSGLPGLVTVSTTERPSTGAFFAGRLFFAGTKTQHDHNNIFFTQIIERPDQFGKCYQENDPTDENFFDLLPTDGGVISIQGAGTVLKLIATKAALIAFCTNGIWSISGSQAQGLGFAANDYTVMKLSAIKTLSATSFVEVQGNILWWNLEGIYIMQIAGDGSQGVQIQSLTNDTISTFYNTIPNVCKANARGSYNPLTFIVQWVFRSTVHSNLTEKYEFDRVLNFNTLTQAFYPWTVANANLKINGIINIDATGGILFTNNVVDNSNNQVVDQFGNNVVTFTVSSNINPISKFIISKPNGITYDFSLGEEIGLAYTDWASLDNVGVNYTSDFATGYSLHGQGQSQFTLDYIQVYSDTGPTVGNNGYKIQGIWDWAIDGNTGRWSPMQRADIPEDNATTARKRFKIRGQGMALQIRFQSIDGVPFSISGWSRWESRTLSP